MKITPIIPANKEIFRIDKEGKPYTIKFTKDIIRKLYNTFPIPIKIIREDQRTFCSKVWITRKDRDGIPSGSLVALSNERGLSIEFIIELTTLIDTLKIKNK